MIYINKKYVPAGVPPSQEVLKRCFEIHIQQKRSRLQKLKDYYDGKHAITERTMKSAGAANNKLVSNHAEYITDMATGYVHGAPVRYSSEDEQAAENINTLFTNIEEDSHNAELGTDISIFGYGLEYIYMSDDPRPFPKLKAISPLSGFLVCDTSLEEKPLFSVTYGPRENLQGTIEGYDLTVATNEAVYEVYSAGTAFTSFAYTTDKKGEAVRGLNPFGAVPLTEYKNNRESKGDFEGVISLIDAYNLLQSDRLNDKEQLVDAILVLVGASLGDDEEEVSETAKFLKEHKLLELPEGAKAEYITKNLNESDVEILKKAIKTDIHEFSKVPCLTDENFAGNASGVAMSYKLIGFEQLAVVKERYFKSGLRRRLRLISNVRRIQAVNIKPETFDIVMSRSLPVDEEARLRMFRETEGHLSWETRIKIFNPEIDVEAERERLLAEKKEAAEIQRIAFSGTANIPPEDDEVDEE